MEVTRGPKGSPHPSPLCNFHDATKNSKYKHTHDILHIIYLQQLEKIMKQTSFKFLSRRALLLARITELILTVILVISRYKNQCITLSFTVDAAVLVKFDSRKLRQK